MAQGISVEAFNIKHARERFKGMQERAKNPKTTMEVIGIKAWKDVISHFREQSGPDGFWPRLSASTIKSRRKGKKKGGPKILQDTGRLRMANRWKIVDGGFTVKVFNNTKYAKYHDSDEPRRGSLPQRKFMWLSPELESKFAHMLVEYIAE